MMPGKEFEVPRIALYTFGILKHPRGCEAMAGFAALSPNVFGEVRAANGFIAHALSERPDLRGKSPLGEDFGAWGRYAVPRFYDGSPCPGEATVIATLSLWRDVQSARQFTYKGPLHHSALVRRRDWFRKPQWPGHVLWWVAETQVPTWRDGVGKLEMLQDHGPTPSAFDFATDFDLDGRNRGGPDRLQ